MNLNTLLGLPDQEVRTNQKIIVLVPEATGGSNVGIIVDDVSSVIQVTDADVDKVGEGFGSDSSAFVKGIIKMKTEEGVTDSKKNLIIWIDMEKVIKDLVEK